MRKTNLPQTNPGQAFYYPELDGLRFLAFFLVFLHHSLINLNSSNQFLNYFLVIIHKNGWVGIDLFFILSGFLITTLLLKERKKYGSFSLKNFWIRRALRIWPLYFLAIIFGFFIAPIIYSLFFGINFSDPKYGYEIQTKLLLYFLFLGNWAVSLYGYSNFHNISHLWTISLEEQFYFLWPIILLYINNFKSTLTFGFFILIISLLARLILVSLGIQHPGIYTNSFTRMDILSMGAILALVIFYKPKLLEKFNKLNTKFFMYIFFILLFVFLHKIYLFDPTDKFKVVFGYLVIGLAMVYLVTISLHSKSILLNYKPIVWLGKISFGLYIWHIFAIDLVFNLLKTQVPEFVLPFIALILTIILSTLSYYLFEINFLKLKNKFTMISSRPV